MNPNIKLEIIDEWMIGNIRYCIYLIDDRDLFLKWGFPKLINFEFIDFELDFNPEF